MCFEGKYVTGPVVIEKAKCFCDLMEITDRYTFSGGWL